MAQPDIPTLASLSLTHVHYNPADPISYLCAWLALVPQALCLTYVLLIYTTREIEIMLLFGGQLACEALNVLLKRYFKEARPPAIRHLHRGYGMPSSHAQFVAFWSVSCVLFLWARRRVVARRGRGPVSPVLHLQIAHPRVTDGALSLAFGGLALAVAWSRIYLSYHTPRQVVVGSALGSLCAAVWFVVTEYARRAGWLDWVLDFALLRSMRIRDLMCEDDLVEIGWRVWEDKAKARAAAKRK